MRVAVLILCNSLTLSLCHLVFHAQAQSLQTAQDQRQTRDWPHDAHHGKFTKCKFFFLLENWSKSFTRTLFHCLNLPPELLGLPPHSKCTQNVFIPPLLGFMSTNAAPLCTSQFFLIEVTNQHSVAQRGRGKKNCWLAWIPTSTLKSLKSATMWVSDQFGDIWVGPRRRLSTAAK